MATERRSITIDISWINDTQYRHAEGSIAAELLNRGWEHVEAGETMMALAWNGAADDFDKALAEAQSLVGRYIVKESE
jgi:hypothetical protein